jgi:SAM-dependent methyltransferase
MMTNGQPDVRGTAKRPEIPHQEAQRPDGQRPDVQRAVQRARHAASQARLAAEARAQRDKLRETLVREMFARPVRDCAHRSLGRPVRVLRAGALTPLEELGLSQLRDRGYEVTVVTVDQPGLWTPPAHASGGNHGPGGDVRLGDLRAVPLPPRSFDIVHCALLLDRIRHVELVLDRLIAALRPGGFLLLRIRDRDCAFGLLDRWLPRPARRRLRARIDPAAAGRRGPFSSFPAVYEKTASDRGIQEYARMRGLFVTQRETTRTWPDDPDRLARTVAATCRLVARLTRGRLTDAHDEVLYVIRKPEERFARVV